MPARQSPQSELNWRKSRASDNTADCVEISSTADAVLVRDSRDRSGALLTFLPAQWSAFVKRFQRRN